MLLDQTRFHASFGYPLKIKQFIWQKKGWIFGRFSICLKDLWKGLSGKFIFSYLRDSGGNAKIFSPLIFTILALSMVWAWIFTVFFKIWLKMTFSKFPWNQLLEKLKIWEKLEFETYQGVKKTGKSDFSRFFSVWFGILKIILAGNGQKLIF